MASVLFCSPHLGHTKSSLCDLPDCYLFLCHYCDHSLVTLHWDFCKSLVTAVLLWAPGEGHGPGPALAEASPQKDTAELRDMSLTPLPEYCLVHSEPGISCPKSPWACFLRLQAQAFSGVCPPISEWVLGTCVSRVTQAKLFEGSTELWRGKGLHRAEGGRGREGGGLWGRGWQPGSAHYVMQHLIWISENLKFHPGSPGCFEGRRIKHILFSNWSAVFTTFKYLDIRCVGFCLYSCLSPTSVSRRPAHLASLYPEVFKMNRSSSSS